MALTALADRRLIDPVTRADFQAIPNYFLPGFFSDEELEWLSEDSYAKLSEHPNKVAPENRWYEMLQAGVNPTLVVAFLEHVYELRQRHDLDLFGQRVAFLAGVDDVKFIELQVGQGSPRLEGEGERDQRAAREQREDRRRQLPPSWTALGEPTKADL